MQLSSVCSLKHDTAAEAISSAVRWAGLGTLSCNRFNERGAVVSCRNSLMKNTVSKIPYGTQHGVTQKR